MKSTNLNPGKYFVLYCWNSETRIVYFNTITARFAWISEFNSRCDEEESEFIWMAGETVHSLMTEIESDGVWTPGKSVLP